jgi:hypothetical protein
MHPTLHSGQESRDSLGPLGTAWREAFSPSFSPPFSSFSKLSEHISSGAVPESGGWVESSRSAPFRLMTPLLAAACPISYNLEEIVFEKPLWLESSEMGSNQF